ncbi:polyketide cyclase [Paenibacillus selenitireducens]|uniref:Polyketide cyclase n=1 Tax=Paenibacillus selenitireducens TaxID=1324314 RepID=A0A1T2X254_9BACL|nr:SRPBCC domain-containing protein [Paenibacillus selenitireducens]OPA73917.1 polyketide cyclase [Paenibacillus selenitireducens]
MTTNSPQTFPDIIKKMMFNAPIQKVWDAVSTAEGIAAWFMPNDFKPILGATFSIHSPYGVSSCEVLELEPPNKLVFSWGEDWLITFALEDLEGQTSFTLIHGGWSDKVAPETGMSHSVIRNNMNNGWESQVLPRLQHYVEASS